MTNITKNKLTHVLLLYQHLGNGKEIYFSLYILYCYCGISCCLYPIIQTLKLFIMKKNMGSTDRILRIIIAAVFAILYFTGTVSGTLGLVLLILGAVFVLTSLISFCPLYSIFGLNTCPAKK